MEEGSDEFDWSLDVRAGSVSGMMSKNSLVMVGIFHVGTTGCLLVDVEDVPGLYRRA